MDDVSHTDLHWVAVCRVDDLGVGEAMRVPGAVPPISVFRSEDGAVFALGDTCSHEVASLADGYVDGATVECPAHFAQFCLRTGAALSLPATKPVPVHRVREEDGQIYVATA